MSGPDREAGGQQISGDESDVGVDRDRPPPPIALGPDEEVAGRPFASLGNYAGDSALLNYLLQDLRVLVRRYVKGEVALEPHQVTTWEVHGLQRRIVTCDPDGITGSDQVHVVGFFGDRTRAGDQDAIDVSEFDLIAELRNHRGILSYSSIELVDHYWANLVVHRRADDREAWRESEVHRRAVDQVAPMAYHGVRIHNGHIPGGICGSGTVVLQSTKYWDYDVSPTWHAVRDRTTSEPADAE